MLPLPHELQHLEEQPDHDGVLGADGLHEQREQPRLRDHRQDADGRDEHGHRLLGEVHHQAEVHEEARVLGEEEKTKGEINKSRDIPGSSYTINLSPLVSGLLLASGEKKKKEKGWNEIPSGEIKLRSLRKRREAVEGRRSETESVFYYFNGFVESSKKLVTLGPE